MRYRRFAWLIIALLFGAIFVIGSQLKSELAPLEDKSRLRIVSTAPEGVSYELMDKFVEDLIELTDTLSEKKSLLSVTSPGFGSSLSINSAFVRIMLV